MRFNGIIIPSIVLSVLAVLEDGEGIIMVISYNGLWKLLIDKNMQRKDLEAALKISPNTIAKMGRGEPVAMTVLLRICEYLDCNIGDVVSFNKQQEA